MTKMKGGVSANLLNMGQQPERESTKIIEKSLGRLALNSGPIVV
jgi:hypothetical protein